MSQDQQSSVLTKLFPESKVPCNGVDIIVKPLPLSKLPLVINAIVRLTEYVGSEISIKDVANLASSELLELMPHCVDRPLDEIPATVAPDIIAIMVEQNISEAVVEKWTALIDRATSLGDAAGPGKVKTPASGSKLRKA